MTDDGGSAFPVPALFDPNGEAIHEGHGGMSLRDYFAAHAPTPSMAWVDSQMSGRALTYETVIARAAYEYADAMLKARTS